jgi:hypothetical protein
MIATAASQPVTQMQQGVLTEEIINKMSINQLK